MQVYGTATGRMGVAGAATTKSAESSRDEQVLGRDAFLKLLVAQLKNQDPLNPVDNQQFVAQLAQLQSLEELRSLGEAMRVMADLVVAGQAGGLLGRTVRALTGRGEVQGRVESVRVEQGQLVLVTDAGEVNLEDVVEIRA